MKTYIKKFFILIIALGFVSFSAASFAVAQTGGGADEMISTGGGSNEGFSTGGGSNEGFSSGGSGTPSETSGLQNPIKVNSIGGLVEELLNIVLIIGVPIVAFFIIYSGFLFVTALGNPEGLEKAKNTFIYTLIGGALLLGAWVLAQGIASTIDSLKS